MSRIRRLAPVVAVLVLAAMAPAASAASLVNATVSGASAHLRACHAALLPAGPNVRTFTATARETGLLLARLDGRKSDWDVAVLGAGGRFVAAAAGPGSQEVATGYVAKGEIVTVQACLVRGAPSSAPVRVDTIALPRGGGAAEKVQILAVDTPTQADRNRLIALGFDDSHSHTPTTLDVVVSSAAEIEKLRANGFTWKVEAADLAAREAERVVLDREYAGRTRRSALPSGRTEYRHLADYEAEMKALAQAHPGLVKLITLKHKTLLGRDVLGLEIAQNVNVEDGKPAMVQLGVHHAREWPAGEHPMEWAIDLIKSYGKDDRITGLVNRTRSIVVPIVNPDGFNLSREAPVDPGNALAMVDLPPDVDAQLPVQDPTYSAALIANGPTGNFAFKRRNCRIKDNEIPKPGECENPDNNGLGVDPNRNYGAFWGGPGASVEVTDDTYRGIGPFSEPETQNVRELVSSRHVTTLITNHTFSNLILRPPGVKSEGPQPDEAGLKALADGMASNNGYSSIPGYGLYDTTGTTEDWSYQATGGYGYTFEIGPDEFHPPFPEAAAEYEGAGQYAGKGNRGAYLLALENTANAVHHSVITGSAPAGMKLRLHKEFDSQTSPVIKDTKGNTGPPINFKDVLDTTLDVGPSGKFEWHINPSTRPYVQKDRKYADIAPTPAFDQDIGSATPVLPTKPDLIEFEVKPGAARQIRATVEGSAPDDYDIYLYQGEAKPENQVSSSASADATETIAYGYPIPGKYVLEVRNYSAVQPYTGRLQVFGEQAGTEVITKAHDEAWTLTCERAGAVLATTKVEVKRGAAKDLGAVCERAQGTEAALTLGLRVPNAKKLRLRKVLRRGIKAVATCSRTCTVAGQVRLDKKTAKRLRIKDAVAKSKPVTFSGKRTLTMRFTKKAARKLRRLKRATLTVSAVGRDQLRNVKAGSVRLRLRR
jgi:murein tripeptide amidase MpaA